MNKYMIGLSITLLLGLKGIAIAQDAPAVPSDAPAAAETTAPAATDAPTTPRDTSIVADGNTVKFEYTLKVNNEVVDSSDGKEPIEYVHGQGKVIPGIEKNLVGMKVGQEKDFTLKPEDAYGPNDPQGIQEVQKTLIPSDIELAPGTVLEMVDASQNVFPAKVVEVKADTVVLDFNHPLAGKELSFHTKVIEIK